MAIKYFAKETFLAQISCIFSNVLFSECIIRSYFDARVGVEVAGDR